MFYICSPKLPYTGFLPPAVAHIERFKNLGHLAQAPPYNHKRAAKPAHMRAGRIPHDTQNSNPTLRAQHRVCKKG